MLRSYTSCMDKELRPSRLSEQLNKHYAAIATPQGLYCLLLRLTDEYSSNALAREQLRPRVGALSFMDNSYCYFVLASDNILAASVVIRSTVRSSLKPEKIVFLVITDKKWHLVMNLSAGKPAFGAFSRSCSWRKFLPCLQCLRGGFSPRGRVF